MKYERKNILRNRKVKILTLMSIDILMIDVFLLYKW